GAGAGELAAALTAAGYDVLAIDPASEVPWVNPVALLDVDEPPASFDAAVAVFSLHHAEPLAESSARLAELLRPGAPLVIDEFDVDRYDERAAAWWLHHRGKDGDPAGMVANLRDHLHSMALIRATLEPWFALGGPIRGPYLYRWDVPPGLRPTDGHEIAARPLPS